MPVKFAFQISNKSFFGTSMSEVLPVSCILSTQESKSWDAQSTSRLYLCLLYIWDPHMLPVVVALVHVSNPSSWLASFLPLRVRGIWWNWHQKDLASGSATLATKQVLSFWASVSFPVEWGYRSSWHHIDSAWNKMHHRSTSLAALITSS